MAEGSASVSMDWQTIVNRVLAYTIEGLVVAIALWVIPSKGLKMNEILTTALVAAAVFALLDMYMPNSTIAQSARQGTGLGLGFGITGFGI